MRYIQSGKEHLAQVKEEEAGDGPPTYWKVLNGPRVVHSDIVNVDSDSDSDV